ncbi:XdhC family protein [Lachnospiraceae bacterium HCP28S3_F9]|nr:XdhC family protein [Lachnospiraceae bacterium]MDY2614487.1 XdhC/CoxI family protein [Lachnospiraceae bacterium]MDY4207502.1 XdhC/CoxI family protein [Lachnospiraceae bacterium]
MKTLFEAIEQTDSDLRRMVLTVIDEEFLAEKAITVEGRIVWESRPGGFFAEYQKEIQELKDCEVIELGGHRVFCDLLGEDKRIVICGGGHVSIPVIMLGVMMGCEVTVLEDRPSYADDARRAGATTVICEPFEKGLEKVSGSADTFFVIVTRGHRYDQICLEKIAQKEHAYIGMIGSRKRTAMVKENLKEKGIDSAVLDAVYTPIGLNINAETPVEIAVAIMAEIIQVKNRQKRSGGYTKEMIKAVLEQEPDHSPKVLATIVARKGSAPRGIGTKMLILRNGKCIGTIGGGCMEANVIQKARLMVATGMPKARICQVDMTGNDAEEEGMVCGGVISVLLELI